MDPPLEGIPILDASRVLVSPFCTKILSDLGAKVIKIEDHGMLMKLQYLHIF